jgi:hypothetical protein
LRFDPLSFVPACLHHAVVDFTSFEGFVMKKTIFWSLALLFLGAALAFAPSYAGPRITRTQDVSDSADTPYQKILVIALLSKFDSRRRLENAVVNELSERGSHGVASTSMMDTKTPVTRETFRAMLEELDSDAVLVTQLVDIESEATMTESASPEASLKVRPTYYFNVWEVELKEYVEPQSLQVKSSFVLATQLYSVLSEDAVWAIESKSKVVESGGPRENYLVFLDEGEAIVKYLWRDRLIAR